MEKLSTDNVDTKKSSHFSRDLKERFLYGLATAAFCAVPFLIPGITTRQEGMFFFGEIALLFLGIIVISLVINYRDSQKRRTPRKR